jgi:peptidoglycan/xylan/chitin deacetylase (PgdA/CDA1 family)
VSKFSISLGVYFTVIVILFYWMYASGHPNLISVLAGVTVVYLGFIFWMSLRLDQNFFLSAIHQNTTDEVVLTFDDGPHPEYTLRILDTLDEFKVKAVFFLIGKNALEFPKVVEEIQKRGHQIGSHTQNHSYNFGFFIGSKLKQEIQGSIDAIQKVTGTSTPIFRPPFGVTNPNIASAVKALGLSTIGWNVRSFDTATNQSSVIVNRVITQVKPGSIILLHDRLSQTCESLPEIISQIQGKGFAIGPLETKTHV